MFNDRSFPFILQERKISIEGDMKNFIFVICSFVLTAQLSAQEQTLIDQPIQSGGYGGPVVRFSEFNNKFAVLVGGYGGWLINHSFLLGGGGYGLVNNIIASPAAQLYYGATSDLRTQFGYGGLFLEYTGDPNALIHYSVSTLIGGGSVNYGYWNSFSQSYYDALSRTSTVFVFEPGVGAELNITRFFRLNSGVSYRLVRGSDLPGITDSDMSNFSAFLTFKFGAF